jgi:hypothetical protein
MSIPVREDALKKAVVGLALIGLVVSSFSQSLAPAKRKISIQLVTATSSLCRGKTQVRIEASSEPPIVKMDLYYWEDQDSNQGHTYYQHFLAKDITVGNAVRYDICWDVLNSPRHSGGFWKLEGVVRNSAGETASFLTPPFTINGNCSSPCRSETIVLVPDKTLPLIK